MGHLWDLFLLWDVLFLLWDVLILLWEDSFLLRDVFVLMWGDCFLLWGDIYSRFAGFENEFENIDDTRDEMRLASHPKKNKGG